jgi:hypothetical protein
MARMAGLPVCLRRVARRVARLLDLDQFGDGGKRAGISILIRKLSDVTMEQRRLAMSKTAAVMETCNPMGDWHAGSALVTGDYARGTSYHVPITFTRF